MTGHSLWNRNGHPFLRCACKSGMAADEKHVCTMIGDNDYSDYKKKSHRKWGMRKVITSSRQRGPGRQKQYDAKAHRDWCDLNNKGICHFGAVPLSYLISFLRFDVFHGRGNIVKVAGMYIRRLFDGDINSIETFAKILADLPGWGDYEISPWITGDSQSRLKGKHTKFFTHNIGKITDALSEM